eukprot:355676-Chlamydomonas_euryale.AAC.7
MGRLGVRVLAKGDRHTWELMHPLDVVFTATVAATATATAAAEVEATATATAVKAEAVTAAAAATLRVYTHASSWRHGRRVTACACGR